MKEEKKWNTKPWLVYTKREEIEEAREIRLLQQVGCSVVGEFCFSSLCLFGFGSEIVTSLSPWAYVQRRGPSLNTRKDKVGCKEISRLIVTATWTERISGKLFEEASSWTRPESDVLTRLSHLESDVQIVTYPDWKGLFSGSQNLPMQMSQSFLIYIDTFPFMCPLLTIMHPKRCKSGEIFKFFYASMYAYVDAPNCGIGFNHSRARPFTRIFGSPLNLRI